MIYFGVGTVIGLDWLRLLAGRIASAEHWDRLATRRLVDDLFAAQRAISQSLLADLLANGVEPRDVARRRQWRPGPRRMPIPLARTRDFLSQLEVSGDLSIAKLTLANSQIHKLSDI